MKNLSKSLHLSKSSIQILDEKNLVDTRGGAAGDVSCNEGSCQAKSCWYASCREQ